MSSAPISKTKMSTPTRSPFTSAMSSPEALSPTALESTLKSKGIYSMSIETKEALTKDTIKDWRDKRVWNEMKQKDPITAWMTLKWVAHTCPEP